MPSHPHTPGVMEDSLEELRLTLRNEMSRAEQAIDRKKGEAQRTLERLRREELELRDERERFEAERACFADSQAALQDELEEVARLRAELEGQRNLGIRGFWACCMCPQPPEKKPEVVNQNGGSSVDVFGIPEDPVTTRTELGFPR
mmetsp:Transcript_25641/g.51725  ORF Transcript_25641/g.51725 Transcript_25641/m.51725 type:complete len:146 (-) Transcript_25641:392-829(-)